MTIEDFLCAAANDSQEIQIYSYNTDEVLFEGKSWEENNYGDRNFDTWEVVDDGKLRLWVD